MLKHLLIFSFTLVFFLTAKSQGSFSGSLQANTDFFILDSNIQAPQDININYTNNKSSQDITFQLKYNNNDFGIDAGVRFDVFNNSILFTPTQPYSGYGIGNWFVKKSFDKMKITAGNFYDQFGSGIAFRAYEERALGIDNSLLGAHVELNPKEFLRIKAFAGLQKYQFTYFNSLIKGINIDFSKSLSEKVDLNTGISAVNRTLDNTTRSLIKSTIDGYADSLRFSPVYNTYVFSLYNTIKIGRVSWFIEDAYKTKEAIYYPENYLGQYVNKDGSVLYTSLSYSKKGFGISGQLKRTENFNFHATSEAEINVNKLNSSRLAFIPSTVKQHSLRLPARYVAASQEIEEFAGALDITLSIKDKYAINVNGSAINSLGRSFQAKGDSSLFYIEGYIDFEFKKSKNGKMKGMVGGQYQRINQKFYQGAEWESRVDVISVFGEYTYKFTKKMSLRSELQYQYVPKDFGQWIYGLIEFNIAPRWSFSISDMFNFVPNLNNVNEVNHKPKHYYSLYTSYTHKQHRFSLSFVKQVGGIVCTGGVCRPEPAFSGVKFGMTSNF
ncbi:MAG: hypothetical protein IPK03_02315 [Bacteroidetes bacterium]|nr:hypothetical protein [Bacteroidota bacterium]